LWSSCSASVPTQQQQVQNRLQLGNHPDVLWVEPTYVHWGSDCRQLKRQILTEAQGTACYNAYRADLGNCSVSQPSSLEAPRSAVVLEQAETMAEAAMLC